MLAAMSRAQEAVRASTEQMRKSIESIGGSLAKIQTAFMAFAAVATGGEAIKKLVTSAGDWQMQAVKLASALGITTERASVYQIAMHRLGIESDVMITGAAKLSKQIYTNHEAFLKLGVATKDAHGNYRPLAEIMDSVNEKLIGMHNRTEQNIAGTQVYGKAWSELRPILKLNADEMAHAEEEGKRLGLIVGPQGAAMAREYKKALADVDLVGKSFTLQMGNQLLPVMTQVGSAFASAAPAIGEFFGNALKMVARIAIDVGSAFQALGTHIGGWLAAGMAFLRGDWAGAKQVLKEVSEEVDAIDKKAEEMKAKLDAPRAASKAPDNSNTGVFDDNENGGKSRVSGWAEKLSEEKAAYETSKALAGDFREFDKEQERAYWQEKLKLVVKGTAEEREVRAKIADATIAINKKAFDAQVGELKAEEAAFKNNTEARLTIETALAEKMKKAYGEESSQYKEAKKAIVATEAQAAADILAIQRRLVAAERGLAMASIDEQEAQSRFEVELGVKTNAEALADERAFENQRFAIKREALVRDLALEAQNPDRDPKKIAEINGQILALETQHEMQLSALRRKSVLDHTKNYREFVTSVTSGFQSVIAGFLKGTQTLGQTIKGLFSAVLDAIANTIAKMAAEWIAKKLMMLAVDKTTGASTIATSVAEAGAAGVASFAGAPWPIDLGAPAFGAAMAAAAGAYGAVASAAGGFDIPAGANPVTQLHAREMVLPASLAEPLRDSLAGGGMGGGRVSFHIQAMDGASVERYLRNGGAKVFAAHIDRELKRFNGRGA